MDKPSWKNPLPSSAARARGKTGGYTKPDNAVRCKVCGVGQDEGGNMIGTPIAQYSLSCSIPEGGSVEVARFGRCYKCRTLVGDFVITEKGKALGIEFSKAAALLKQTNGTMFTLWELTSGKIDTTELRPYPGTGKSEENHFEHVDVIKTDKAPGEGSVQESIF